MSIRYRYEVHWAGANLELHEYVVVRTTAKCEWVVKKGWADIYANMIDKGRPVSEAAKKCRAKRIMVSADRRFARRQKQRIRKAARSRMLARGGLYQLSKLYPDGDYNDSFFTEEPDYV